MKFGTELQAHLTPEWRQQYIEYEGLKTLLFSMLDKKHEYLENYSDYGEDPDGINELFDHSFFEGVMSEIKRINIFFQEKESETMARYTKLTSEFHRQLELLHQQSRGKEKSDIKGKKVVAIHPARIKKLENKIYDKFRMAFSEYYLNLILLQNYQALNYTGFRKILKKYDKVMESKRGKKCFASHVRGTYFEKSKEVEKLIEHTEKFVTNTLEKGDRNQAMQKLRVPPLSGLELHEHSTTFKSGLVTGLAAAILVVVILGSTIQDQIKTDGTAIVADGIPALVAFRSTFLLFFFTVLISWNTYGWRNAGVNHILIFEIDPRDHLNYLQLLTVGMLFIFLWGCTLVLYIFSPLVTPSMKPETWPLIFFIIVFGLFLLPAPIFYHRTRLWLLKRLFRIFTSPVFDVQFADFFIADQLNSLTTVLLDISFVLCYYTTYWGQGEGMCTKPGLWYRVFIALLPPWFRFAQSVRRYFTTSDAFPHLFNAGKYFSSILVVVVATVTRVLANKDGTSNLLGYEAFSAYIFFACVSTLYAYWWDIKMDWGFLDHTSTGHKNKYLRDELLYAGGKKFVYFIIMGLDLVLRCVWTINISMADWSFTHKQYIITGTAILEAFRRSVWNFVRLENEHLNNCGQFRAVRDINVRVISEDQKQDEVEDNESDEEDDMKVRRMTSPREPRHRSSSGTNNPPHPDQGSSTLIEPPTITRTEDDSSV